MAPKKERPPLSREQAIKRIAFLLLVWSLTWGHLQAENSKPNLILIMADDLGYQDLSCYGSTKHKTPVLDKLAKEGIRLTSFYAGATVCTPSRMALLTGAYPPRAGWRGGVVGYGIKPLNGLTPEALTMGEVFREAGYETALIGKWHLGDSPELQPMNQGFDTAYYIKKSNNQTKKLWRGDKLEADPFNNSRLTEQFTREAISFIKANREKPFFVYLPFTAPHFPAQAHPDWKGKSVNGAYGDVVEELDARIGEILGTLKSTRLEKRTIVVFISDNGPEPGQKKWAQAGPYRGLKWSSLEGGTRVPCIIRWPGMIPAGRESEKLTTAIDLLPTLSHACGIELKKVSKHIPKLDGFNVWGTLSGKSTQHPRTNMLYWQGWAVPQAIRVGDWKLYFDQVKEIQDSNKGPVLIDLSKDPAEQKNLSAQHPDKVKEMKILAGNLLKEIEGNTIPLGGPPIQQKEAKESRWLK
ncbi:MAG: sulfatase-like hydrolase/transferase [Limisphaerales bacterium]